jgi:hypothetical protein
MCVRLSSVWISLLKNKKGSDYLALRAVLQKRWKLERQRASHRVHNIPQRRVLCSIL